MKKMGPVVFALVFVSVGRGYSQTFEDLVSQKSQEVSGILQAQGGRSVPSSPIAPSVNQHFSCFATGYYGALQVEVEQMPNAVRVRLQGIFAGNAAASLGLSSTDSIEVTFNKEWCNASADKFGVVSCSVPDWRWPRPVLPIKALDRDGNVRSKGTLSVFQLDLEKTQRTSASGTHEFIELEASAISETDNSARAELRMRYEPRDCKTK